MVQCLKYQVNVRGSRSFFMFFEISNICGMDEQKKFSFVGTTVSLTLGIKAKRFTFFVLRQQQKNKYHKFT